MAYSPIFTSEARIEGFLQIAITTASNPSTAETLDIIEEVETSMLKQGWGTQTAVSGTYLTVHPTGASTKGTVAWYLQDFPVAQRGRLVVPPFKPIQSVTSGAFFRNKASLTSAPDMELLTCRDNLPNTANTDFMIIREYNHKTGNNDGVALYFFHDIPYAGYNRLTGGWVYGYNINSKILREYATLKSAEKVILARLFSGNPSNLATFTGGDVAGYVNTEYEAQLMYISKTCEEIERKHLPDPLPLAAIQGI